jgi:hypothetical protein
MYHKLQYRYLNRKFIASFNFIVSFDPKGGCEAGAKGEGWGPKP